MRVLMTADPIGGVWTYALELARGLGGEGIEVCLATMGRPLTPLQRQRSGHVPGLRVFESELRLEWMRDAWADVERAGRWLLGIAERVKPEVVHLNGYVHAALPWPAPCLTVGHSCHAAWWQAVHGTPAPPDWARYDQRVRAGLAAADLVVTPTFALLGELDRLYGPLPRVRVIPHGRDAARFAPQRKEEMVLSAGRLWDPAKNLALLERVAPRLAWPLYVAGERRSPDGGDELPTEHTHALGRLSSRALANWLGRAAIYCLTSRYEPFGITALEAALSGCALVLGDLPSLREVWEDAARYVDPDDADGLARTLGELIDRPAERRELAARAGERARSLSGERMAASYAALYRALAARGEPAHDGLAAVQPLHRAGRDAASPAAARASRSGPPRLAAAEG